MTELEVTLRERFLDGLIGYLEAREWALSKLLDTNPGVHPYDFRMHHYIYFANAFGAIDYIEDCADWNRSQIGSLGVGFKNRVRAEFDHETDYYYARGLRNAAIHRGLDPSMVGGQHEGKIYAICPPAISYGHGKRRANYACSVTTTADLARLCNVAANKAMRTFVTEHNFLNEASIATEVRQLLESVRNSYDTPDCIREDIGAALNREVLPEFLSNIAIARVARLKVLLSFD